jgi:hypothetical protein
MIHIDPGVKNPDYDAFTFSRCACRTAIPNRVSAHPGRAGIRLNMLGPFRDYPAYIRQFGHSHRFIQR